jgi:hypothetical protein
VLWLWALMSSIAPGPITDDELLGEG